MKKPIKESFAPVATPPIKSKTERKIFNVRSIRERQYHTLDLGEEYNHQLGRPEARFVATAYGPSGSGKSVYVLKLANYFAGVLGHKVLYNSHEEKINQTLQERIKRFKIEAQRLYFGNCLSYDEMVAKTRRNHYRLLIIDSVQYMNFTYEQLKDLRFQFRKRDLSIILVSFGKSIGTTDGANKLLHASDIKLYFHNGKMRSISRYLSEPVNTIVFDNTNQQKLEL